MFARTNTGVSLLPRETNTMVQKAERAEELEYVLLMTTNFECIAHNLKLRLQRLYGLRIA
jgi:hypothetical protein